MGLSKTNLYCNLDFRLAPKCNLNIKLHYAPNQIGFVIINFRKPTVREVQPDAAAPLQKSTRLADPSQTPPPFATAAVTVPVVMSTLLSSRVPALTSPAALIQNKIKLKKHSSRPLDEIYAIRLILGMILIILMSNFEKSGSENPFSKQEIES